MMNSNEYMREYMRSRYHKRRAMAIKYLGGVCVVCSSTENLELDHKDRARKSFSLSKLWSVNEETFMLELSKCQLLCKEHHKEKTLTEISVEHGGGVSGKKGCSCEKCRAKKAEYMRNYRQRRAGVA